VLRVAERAFVMFRVHSICRRAQQVPVDLRVSELHGLQMKRSVPRVAANARLSTMASFDKPRSTTELCGERPGRCHHNMSTTRSRPSLDQKQSNEPYADPNDKQYIALAGIWLVCRIRVHVARDSRYTLHLAWVSYACGGAVHVPRHSMEGGSEVYAGGWL
jgi:hypothetical protein